MFRISYFRYVKRKTGKNDAIVHRCADKLEELVKDIAYAYKLELKSLKLSKAGVDV